MKRIRKNLGVAGLIVACVALIAALGGSAIAANGGSSGDATASAKKNRKGGGNVNKLIKREARKFSKQFSLAFAKRFPGPIGPQGFPGLPGASGSDGSDGDDGSDGSDGTNGVSAEGIPFGPTEEPEGEPCEGGGGVEVTSASPEPSYLCNGEEGSPWSAGGVLPEGATETGTWGWTSQITAIGTPAPGISFTIRLANPLDEEHIHYIDGGNEIYPNNTGEPHAACTGSAGNPTAASGHLCIYETIVVNGEVVAISNPGGSPPSAGVGGALLSIKATSSTFAVGNGAWAVTG